MSKSSAQFVDHEPPPPLPTILVPLPLPRHTFQNPSNHQLTDLRHTLENFQLSNGSSHPDPGSPNSRRRSQTTPHKPPYPEVRIARDGDLRFDSDASQISKVSETVPQN